MVILTALGKTVYSEKCRSWYKLGQEDGRVVGLWPGSLLSVVITLLRDADIGLSGSSLHAMKALEHPRWEDYVYEHADEVDDTLYWLGDGQTFNEKTLSGDSGC